MRYRVAHRQAAQRSGLTQVLGRMKDIVASGRSFWLYYVSAWLFFPVLIFMIRCLNMTPSEWWVPVFLFSLAAGIAPWIPWLRGHVTYWTTAFWAIFVPLVALLLALVVTPEMGAA